MNSYDVYTALKSAETPLFSCLSTDDCYLLGQYETAHDLGRWIEAALWMEHSIGTVIPEKIEKMMRIYLRSMMSNPYALLLNDAETLGNGCVNFHNLREGLLALSALVTFRDSAWAKECGERLLDTIDRLFFEKTLTVEEICRVTGLPLSDDPMVTRPESDPYRYDDDTPTTGRAIEGMLHFYLATGSERALAVTKKAVTFHRKHSLSEDGGAPAWMTCAEHVGHNHSYLGTLRGLLLYAIHTNDRTLIDAIYRTYRHSIYQYNCTLSGFAPHDLACRRFDDENGDPCGDPASCADIAYIAFLLAENGYSALFDDAERLIRARLLKTQHNGGWGIYRGYFSTASTIDVFASIDTTLARIYQNSAAEDADGLWIRLYFSKNHPSAEITAHRTTHQHIRLVPKKKQHLHFRIPQWCDANTVFVADENGQPIDFKLRNRFAVIDKTSVTSDHAILLSFRLPLTDTEEKAWGSKKSYTIHWKGDEIVSVDEP